jgi:hypothetical protein
VHRITDDRESMQELLEERDPSRCRPKCRCSSGRPVAHTAAPSREGAADPMDCGFRIMLEQPIVDAPVH